MLLSFTHEKNGTEEGDRVICWAVNVSVGESGLEPWLFIVALSLLRNPEISESKRRLILMLR